MTVVTPICARCRYFDSSNRKSETCTAFPQGIPAKILSGENSHRTSMAGDHGLQFTPLSGFEWMLEEAE